MFYNMGAICDIMLSQHLIETFQKYFKIMVMETRAMDVFQTKH